MKLGANITYNAGSWICEILLNGRVIEVKEDKDRDYLVRWSLERHKYYKKLRGKV